MLASDFGNLESEIKMVNESDADWFHLDVMDGNWVVNETITFGPAVVQSVRERVGPNIFVDCHLMITNAERTWKQYADAGVDLIIAHIEAINDPATLISEIRESGTMVGLVLNPDTESNAILPYLSELDLVLVMSVVPGKGGQSFMPEVEGKVRTFRAAIDEQISGGGRKTKLMIDGGIKAHNASMVASWGVDVAVIGSGLINDRASIAENISEIRSK